MQQGFTLAEMMAVLSLFILVVGAVFSYFALARGNAVLDRAQQGALSIVNAIQQAYPVPLYTGIVASRITPMLPADMVATVSGAPIMRDAWGQTIAVSAPSASEYRLSYAAVPLESCVPFVVGVEPMFRSVTVNGTTVKATGGALVRATLDGACANVSNTVALTGN
jgi:prepilin-type N-terminal cleavage/methylation domain-containing protein